MWLRSEQNTDGVHHRVVRFRPSKWELMLLELNRLGGVFSPHYDRGANADYALASYFTYVYPNPPWQDGYPHDPRRKHIQDDNSDDDSSSASDSDNNDDDDDNSRDHEDEDWFDDHAESMFDWVLVTRYIEDGVLISDIVESYIEHLKCIAKHAKNPTRYVPRFLNDFPGDVGKFIRRTFKKHPTMCAFIEELSTEKLLWETFP